MIQDDMHTAQHFRDVDMAVDVVIHMVSVQEEENWHLQILDTIYFIDTICCILKGVNTNELIINATDRR